METSLDHLINETLSTITVPENVKIYIELKKGFNLIVDSQLMRRVFTNLITNALQTMICRRGHGKEHGLRRRRTQHLGASCRRGSRLVPQGEGLGNSEEFLPLEFFPRIPTVGIVMRAYIFTENAGVEVVNMI